MSSLGPIQSRTPNYGFAKVNFDWFTWHDYEHENWALADALFLVAIGATNVKGVWQPNTEMFIGERWVDGEDSTMWECNVDHVSGNGTFAQDRVANPTYWSSVSIAGDVLGPPTATQDAIAVYANTTGKTISDSGTTVADLLAGDAVVQAGVDANSARLDTIEAYDHASWGNRDAVDSHPDTAITNTSSLPGVSVKDAGDQVHIWINDIYLPNLIADGEMEWAQESGSSNPQSGGGYITDSFLLDRSGWGGQTRERRDAADSPIGLDDPAAIHARSTRVIATAAHSPAATDRSAIRHAVEGRDIVRLRVGRSQPATVTFGFWAIGNKPGTASFTLLNGDASRAYVTPFTINEADKWEFKSITVTLDDAGTWPLGDSAVGLYLHWYIGAGSGLQTANVDAWQDGQAGAPNVPRVVQTQGNWGQSINDYMGIAGVSMYESDRWVGFPRRTHQQIYEGVARRYQKSYERNILPGAITENGAVMAFQGNIANTDQIYCLQLDYPVLMRASPVHTWYSTNIATKDRVRNVTIGSDMTVASTLRGNSKSSGYPSLTANAANGNLFWAQWTADARI